MLSEGDGLPSPAPAPAPAPSPAPAPAPYDGPVPICWYEKVALATALSEADGLPPPAPAPAPAPPAPAPAPASGYALYLKIVRGAYTSAHEARPRQHLLQHPPQRQCRRQHPRTRQQPHQLPPRSTIPCSVRVLQLRLHRRQRTHRPLSRTWSCPSFLAAGPWCRSAQSRDATDRVGFGASIV